MRKIRFLWVTLIVVGIMGSLMGFPIMLFVCFILGLTFMLYDITSSVGEAGICDVAGAMSVVEEDY